MKHLWIILLVTSLFKYNYSQSQDIDIQEIKEIDSLLEKSIYSFINTKEKEFSNFKTTGYIVVSLDYYNQKAINNEIYSSYTIKDQYISIRKDSDFKLPLLYAFINKKLVLLYISTVDKEIEFSRKSRNRLIKIINQSLGDKEHLVVYDSKGNKIIDDKNFNPTESYNIHGGVKLKIYANRRIEITKKKY
ncbi:hypothetical protein G3567_09895 [Psychroflexus sp. YR1-1]|uniref:Uncharacterized protein n=1 Tax=Psychroflexus aurantiacus TaxID=2709310 RepID=A0A6B3R2F6_9FLAO|nr:hypothetical protein [Psychroflexus aurantiacus]NEV94452.1 hypothetical protein [Psychroflexus aurantiacus]